MAGLSTNAPGLWGGFAGLLYGSTSLSTPPGFLADAPPAWVPDGGVLAFEFDNGLGYNSRNLATTTPDSILTYTSPSPKMVYGSDGVLRYAPHNLLLRSQEFDNAYWTKNSGGISADAGVSPSSLTDADKLIGVASATQQWVYKTAITVANGVSHTVSCYMKADGYNFSQLRILTGGTIANVGFNLSTGEIYSAASGSGTITDVGGGWYRCTATGTSSSTSAEVYINVADTASLSKSFTGDGTSGILIWGAQLNLGPSALTYVPTTSAAVCSLPIDHNPTTFAPLGVLIEEQRTNLLTYSEQFDNAAWTKTGSSITGASINAAVAPDGTTTADKIVENTANSTHGVSVVNTGGAASTASTFSIFAKAAERSKLRILNTDNATGGVEAIFDLAAGTVGAASTSGNYSSGSAAIQDVGNGWYRCSVVATKTGAGNTSIVPIVQLYTTTMTYLGDGASGAYVWGAQVEQAASFPTSYIPTVASQVTRLADQVSILTSAFGYSAAAGTLVVAANPIQVSTSAYPASLNDGASNELIGIRIVSSRWRLYVRDNSADQANIDAGSAQASVMGAAAAAWAADDFAISRNGASAIADGTGTLPTVTKLNVGRVSAGDVLNGHIKRLTYFPTRRTNADLQVLST